MTKSPVHVLCPLVFFVIFCNYGFSVAVAGCDGAGNCYVRQGATGNGTGSDWTNAYKGFGTGTGQVNPSSMMRGVTYWVAGGNYNIGSTITFNTPISGSALITIKAPTAATHGTATGWSNSFQSQAVFSAIVLNTGHWVIDGSYRGSGTGKPATDWRTGYGFKVNNNNGSNAPINSTAAIDATDSTNGDYTIKYVEVNGSHDQTGTYADRGMNFPVPNQQVGTTANVLYNYIHDLGECPLVFDTYETATIEYNWLMNNQSTGAHHAEGSALRGTVNVIYGFNYLENMYGTGVLGTPYAGTGVPVDNNWYFFSNVELWNPSEEGAVHGNSYAIIQFWGQTWNTLAFYNNTIYQIGSSSQECSLLNGGNAGTLVQNLIFENNLLVNCNGSHYPGGVGSQIVTLTYEHNSYFSVTGTIDDTGTGLQKVSGVIPFNNASSNDFALTQDTTARMPINDPNGLGFNTDLMGNPLSSSRGAFQFNSGTVVNPPTGLTYAVN